MKKSKKLYIFVLFIFFSFTGLIHSQGLEVESFDEKLEKQLQLMGGFIAKVPPQEKGMIVFPLNQGLELLILMPSKNEILYQGFKRSFSFENRNDGNLIVFKGEFFNPEGKSLEIFSVAVDKTTKRISYASTVYGQKLFYLPLDISDYLKVIMKQHEADIEKFANEEAQFQTGVVFEEDQKAYEESIVDDIDFEVLAHGEVSSGNFWKIEFQNNSRRKRPRKVQTLILPESFKASFFDDRFIVITPKKPGKFIYHDVDVIEALIKNKPITLSNATPKKVDALVLAGKQTYKGKKTPLLLRLWTITLGEKPTLIELEYDEILENFFGRLELTAQTQLALEKEKVIGVEISSGKILYGILEQNGGYYDSVSGKEKANVELLLFDSQNREIFYNPNTESISGLGEGWTKSNVTFYFPPPWQTALNHNAKYGIIVIEELDANSDEKKVHYIALKYNDQNVGFKIYTPEDYFHILKQIEKRKREKRKQKKKNNLKVSSQ